MMSKHSLLTVAIPTYKRCVTVEALCKSVIPQLEDGDELLVVDDGSNDGTVELLSKIDRVRLITNMRNEGMVKTWNKCLTSASHDWVCMIHDDDILVPNALRTIRKVCSLWGKPALIGHKYSAEGTDDGLRYRVIEPGAWAVLHPFAVPSGVTIHKEILETAGLFDEQFQYSTDIEYFSRICKTFTSICIENPRILFFNLHDQNYEFKTWGKSDFISQLESIEKAIINYAELPEEEATSYFRNKMNSYVNYILKTSSQASDKSLMRKVGLLVKDRPYLGKRNRIAANFAAFLNWIPNF